MTDRDPQQPDEYIDITPDGDEPDFDADTIKSSDDESAEEMLDKLDLGSPGEDGAESSIPFPSDGALAKLQQKHDELEEKLLRTQADYQNYVRRSGREMETMRQQRVVEIARALTTVLDHFDRALQVDPGQADGAEVLAGVASIRDEMLKSLSAFGLQRLEVAPGEEFDPNRHDALMHQPHDDIEAGHVIQTFMPGYFVNDTPVRPAQVSVAQ